jgi:hypothetical protein
MVFNVTLNNISVISWLSVLLVEESVVLRENPGQVYSIQLHVIKFTRDFVQVNGFL